MAQQKEDACCGRSGHVFLLKEVVLYEMEGEEDELDDGAVTLVVDFTKPFDEVKFEVVWTWAIHVDLRPKKC